LVTDTHGLSRWSQASVVGVLMLLAAASYANTLLNGFVYDDFSRVLNNPYLQSVRHLREIFGGSVASSFEALGVTNYYRPLITSTFLLVYQLGGPVAYGFHLLNVCLHAAVVCLLVLVTNRMFQNRNLAFVAAALFALHPIHTESVAWISGLTDLELTFFLVLAFYFFLATSQPDSKGRGLAHLAMAGSFLLALLSKEQAVTLPLLATVYEHLYRDDRAHTTWHRKVTRYGVLWLFAFAYVAARICFLGSFAPLLQRPRLSRYQALLSGLALAGEYLFKLVWPARLSVYYSFRASESIVEPEVLAGLGALLFCAAAFLALWRKHHAASFGFVWLLVTLLPVLNARWMTASAFGERYLYLPSVGFCWLLAWAWSWLMVRAASHRTAWRAGLVSALVLILGLYTLRTVTRNRDWRDDIILYARTLAVAPDALLIRNDLGLAYWARGYLQAAEQEWQAVLRADPYSAADFSFLGMLRARQKRYNEAEKLLRRALELWPNDPGAHLHLGAVYAETGRTELAEEHLRAAAALAPHNTDAHNRLGKLYENGGRLEDAELQFRLSVASAPNPGGYSGLGDVLLRRADYVEAERFFKLALSLDPCDSHAHFSLGAIYAATGRTEQADVEIRAGLETDPRNPEALGALEKLRNGGAFPRRP
jgi:Flp pilus assembly protein TadD